MSTRGCPVCGAPAEGAPAFHESNIDPSKLSGFSFASRKTPEFMAHRLVQCPECELVYADEPPDEAVLANAYHVADFDSSEEAADAAAAYLLAIRPTLDALKGRGAALEIGAGTGIFLELLAGEGFSELVGVEPSTAAIEAAPVRRRAWIREGIFREADFAPASFDLICCFMTMEHVRDPRVISDAAFRLLRPGGAFVTVTHDYRAPVNRLLGKRSPIIDIEHMQLFSQRSIARLFETSGFARVGVRAFVNTYALSYWMRLAPLPALLKTAAGGFLQATGAGKAKLGANVGNLISAVFKPG